MKRVIWHWTAGGHTPNSVDLNAYHEVIDGRGNVVKGVHPISSNKSPIKGPYAAHIRNFNSNSIGLALASMRGAVERPFNAGPSPITQAQIEALVKRTAELCREYNISVSRETVLSHAEVAITHKIPQPGKWDITWLPGMAGPGSAIEVGDFLRSKVRGYMLPTTVRPTEPKRSLVDIISDFIKAITNRLSQK